MNQSDLKAKEILVDVLGEGHPLIEPIMECEMEHREFGYLLCQVLERLDRELPKVDMTEGQFGLLLIGFGCANVQRQRDLKNQEKCN